MEYVFEDLPSSTDISGTAHPFYVFSRYKISQQRIKCTSADLLVKCPKIHLCAVRVVAKMPLQSSAKCSSGLRHTAIWHSITGGG